MKLGRLAKKPDPNGAKFGPAAARLEAKLSKGELPPVPLGRHWGWKYYSDEQPRDLIRFGTFRNLEIQDCTCASFGHLDQMVADRTTTPATVTDLDVVNAYEAISYYPTFDSGAANVDALRYFTKRGLIVMAAELDEGNRRHLELAINLCGAAYVGANLPLSAKYQRTWDVVPGDQGKAGGWGGHAMMAIGYDAIGVYFVSWGNIQRATWQWVASYVDEAHAVVHRAWIADTYTPSGYLAAELLADLRAMDVRL